MITPFLNLNLPTPTVTIGPDWAEQINAAFELVDSHDHSSGKGTKIKTSGINIDSDFSLNNFRLLSVRATKFLNLTATLTGSANAGSVYMANGDLYFTNNNGAAVQITSGGSIVSTPTSLQIIQANDVSSDVVINAVDTSVLFRIDTSVPRTITLPLSASTANGRVYIFKDNTGQSFQNAVTIQTIGGDLVEGVSTYEIQSGRESAWIISNGANAWSII
jgi:hypothetical protein